MFVGDIRTPKDFAFSIEHKFYAKIDFYDLFNNSSNLFEWYEQSEADSKLLNKSPLLIVKTNQHKRIVFVKLDYLLKHKINIQPVFIHGDRVCFWLEDLLKAPDSFFFVDKE